jgi:hypothetical protein
MKGIGLALAGSRRPSALRQFLLEAGDGLAEASSNLWPPAVVAAVGGVSSLSPILMTVGEPAGRPRWL